MDIGSPERAPRVLYKRAGDPEELAGYFALRHQVFVSEQGVFKGTDVDERDAEAIHLIAKDTQASEVVGAVRCYRGEGDTWYGGRLAVAPEWRRGSIGAELVWLAVSTVKREGAQRFLAYVQLQNVPFFERLGWRPVGDVVEYMGQTHQLMQADLEEAAERPVARRRASRA